MTVALPLSGLHPSITDPVLRSISLLNEIMGRYPEAISFAPGAPHPQFFDEIDIERHVQRYSRHLRETRHLSEAQIRQLLFQYGPSQGLINDLLAQALRNDEGIDVAAADIVVTVGCQEALLLALRALCPSRNDVLAITNPSFVGITGAARLLGIETVAIAENEDGIDLEALQHECTRLRGEHRRIAALYVAPDFSNPSGTVMGLEARHALLQAAQAHDLLLLEDNAYGFTSPGEQVLPTLKALDRERRVLYFGTCAKICFPGARVGYVVADQPVAGGGREVPNLAAALTLLKNMVTVNTSPVCQFIVGGMLLESGLSLRRLSAVKAALYQRNMALLQAALRRHLGASRTPCPWNGPTGGFFVRIDTAREVTEALLQRSGEDYGVLWMPMRYFYLDRSGDRQIRLSCSYLNPDQIETGVARLARFLDEQQLLP